MSNEAQIRAALNIRITDSTTGITTLDYRSNPTSFNVDVNTAYGPYPGAVKVQRTHTNIDLSQFVQPGLIWMMNESATVTVDVGVYVGLYNIFVPMFKLLPGQSMQGMLSEFLHEDLIPGTGTGSPSPSHNYLSLKARSAACNVRVDVFEGA